MTMTREQVKALLSRAPEGPWRADGEPWNRIVWSGAENRVCFMAHSNGLNDDRDVAASDLAAAAPDLARALLAALDDLDAVKAERGVLKAAIEQLHGPLSVAALVARAEAAEAANAAMTAREGVLRAVLDKARDQGREPDYCYDDEWECTMRFDEWQDLVDGRDLSEPVEINTLFKGPTKYVVNVPNSRDEDGVPDGWDTVMFDTPAEARAALQHKDANNG